MTTVPSLLSQASHSSKTYMDKEEGPTSVEVPTSSDSDSDNDVIDVSDMSSEEDPEGFENLVDLTADEERFIMTSGE